jgi:hypothetical protein
MASVTIASDNPPAWQKDEALCSPWTADNKQREAEQEAGQEFSDPLIALPQVSA